MASNDGRHTAFVTGSGRNIGRSVVLHLARQGCNVIVNGSRDREVCEAVAAEARGHDVDAVVLMGDVGNAEAIGAMAGEALAHFGTVDIVVNNAAIRPGRPFLETTAEDWHRVLDVDLSAAFHTSQAFLPGMIEKNWGRIINFTGMNAIHGYAGRAPVSVAKHGVWGLTKALAKEFGPKGVTVNAISPGPIRPDGSDPEMSQHIEAMVGRIPLGHLGEPDHVAALCAFLASDAGGFVSAQMIACNGGGET